MNISDVVNDIKLSQGLNNIALPYNKPVEVVIAEILKLTVREFSDIVPFVREIYEMKENLRSPNEFLKKMDVYLLPPEGTITRVKSADAEIASSQFQPNEATTNAFTVGTPFIGFGSYYPQDILNATETGAAINKFAGVTSQPPTAKYLGYNKIQLFHFPEKALIKFKIKCEHDPSLETIKDSYYLSFVELATLDVQRTLYANLSQMQNVGSAYKEIQLKIDQWSGAEDKQKELIKEWTGKFHLDNTDLVQFF
jgi:hypothetical protein